jgi:hypothetical protein
MLKWKVIRRRRRRRRSFSSFYSVRILVTFWRTCYLCSCYGVSLHYVGKTSTHEYTTCVDKWGVRDAQTGPIHVIATFNDKVLHLLMWFIIWNKFYIVSRVRRLYKTGYWIDNWIYWITIQLHTYNRVSYNYNWLSQLSLSRAQDPLQTQLALTGHQLTLLNSSPQLTVN